MNPESFVTDKIDWLGHASFRLNGSKSTVYIDPWKLKKNSPPADVICITHSHFDHLSADDVELIRKPATVIIAPPDCEGGFGEAFKPIAPGETLTVGDVTVEAVPAYNVDKDFHPKKNNWVGYVIAIDGVRVYHTGDTDMITEMRNVKTDVVLIPVGGTYTMTVKQAADAVSKINPKVAVPMHCGDIVGTLQDREAFKAASTVPVVILDPIK
jgi:L-ascorbate metabolism protein UlaG (beta-lactamase superfamily)